MDPFHITKFRSKLYIKYFYRGTWDIIPNVIFVSIFPAVKEKYTIAFL